MDSAKCVWITGLSAAGKTTLSLLLTDHIRSEGTQVVRLDGDELRQVLADEAYTREERLALGMRYSRLCQLLTSQGVYVIIAVIGLFEELHVWNRENIDNYIEVFVDVPLSELKIRDPKGLYSRYKKSEIHNIAGLDLQVDFPKNPDIHIKWEKGRTTNSMFEELLNKYV